jgi:hypothetical protein
MKRDFSPVADSRALFLRFRLSENPYPLQFRLNQDTYIGIFQYEPHLEWTQSCAYTHFWHHIPER